MKTRLYGGDEVQTTIRKLTANILCRDHNNELGRTADAAALRFYRHLKASNNPLSLPGSRILRPQVDRTVSGVNFGRWLCKTHCNLMVAHGLTPDPAYIRYAFLKPPGKPIHFYVNGRIGEDMRFADGRDPMMGWRQLFGDSRPEVDSFALALGGLDTIVTTAPELISGRLLDRARVLEILTLLGPFRIVLDWNGEPAFSDAASKRAIGANK